MTTDSPLFDRIRVKPDQDRRLRAECPACDWPGCGGAATHRAPKGRLRANEYWRFCLEHVREYNHSYNFFSGMSEDAIAKYQKDAVTGHRPTWKMGMNGGKGRPARSGAARFYREQVTEDPFGVFSGFSRGSRTRAESSASSARTIYNAERKAFGALGLEAGAERGEIKARFKELVKRHHPDANGGDRGTEDKLREIIQAYNYLKTAGFC